MENLEEQALKVLQLAAEDSALGSLSDLVKEGVSLDKQDERGWTPLHHASEKGNSDNVTNLLENGAKIDVKNEDGQTPVHLAATSCEVEVFTLFLDRGVALEDRDLVGNTVLDLACRSGRSKVVKLLLQRGAIARAKNNLGQTPLHLAAEQGNIESVKFLLLNCVDVDAKDNQGRTALHYAVHSRHLVVVRYLANWAYIDARDRNGESPLFIAAKQEPMSSECVNILFSYGASVNVRNNQSKYVYELKEVSVRAFGEAERVNQARLYLKSFRFCKLILHLQSHLKFHPCADIRATLDHSKTYMNLEMCTEFKIELERIRSTQVTESFSLYDLTIYSDKPLFMLDARLVKKLETLLYSTGFLAEFPIYGYILRNKFKRAKRSRFYLTHRAKEAIFCNLNLMNICHIHVIWEHIFSFLYKEDLLNFIKSEEYD